MGMTKKEFDALMAQKKRFQKQLAEECFKNRKVFIDVNGTYNLKTKWYVYGFEGETEGVGIKEANRSILELFQDKTGAVKCEYSQPVLEGKVPALVYKHRDGRYMKLLFIYDKKYGKHIVAVIHSQKENELMEQLKAQREEKYY